MRRFHDLYLRTGTEDEMLAVLVAAKLAKRDGTLRRVNSPFHTSVDVIGVIYAPTGAMTTDAFGESIPVMSALPGWHVNVRTRRPVVVDALAAVTLSPPLTPSRVFAPTGVAEN